jgi:hypothetical protein
VEYRTEDVSTGAVVKDGGRRHLDRSHNDGTGSALLVTWILAMNCVVQGT